MVHVARMYKAAKLLGGHVIMLGTSPVNTNAALEALQAYPGGLQVGGQLSELFFFFCTDLSLVYPMVFLTMVFLTMVFLMCHACARDYY